MTEQVTATPSPGTAPGLADGPPAWLRERFLEPTEVVRWWSGTLERPTQEWIKNHQELVFWPAFASFFVLPLTGVFLCALLHLDHGGGFFFGAILGIAVVGTVVTVLATADKHTWSVLTDRRLFVIEGRKKKHDFDLDLLRSSIRATGASGAGADDRVVDLSKLQAVTSGPKRGPLDGITDLGSILATAQALSDKPLRAPSRFSGPA